MNKKKQPSKQDSVFTSLLDHLNVLSEDEQGKLAGGFSTISMMQAGLVASNGTCTNTHHCNDSDNTKKCENTYNCMSSDNDLVCSNDRVCNEM